MEPKSCQTHYDTADKAVTDEPTLVYWIFVEVTALATKGTLYIRDGFDTSAEIKIKIAVGYNRPHCFCPAIRCAHGLFVDMVDGLTSFTVGFLPERLVTE